MFEQIKELAKRLDDYASIPNDEERNQALLAGVITETDKINEKLDNIYAKINTETINEALEEQITIEEEK